MIIFSTIFDDNFAAFDSHAGQVVLGPGCDGGWAFTCSILTASGNAQKYLGTPLTTVNARVQYALTSTDLTTALNIDVLSLQDTLGDTVGTSTLFNGVLSVRGDGSLGMAFTEIAGTV